MIFVEFALAIRLDREKCGKFGRVHSIILVVISRSFRFLVPYYCFDYYRSTTTIDLKKKMTTICFFSFDIYLFSFFVFVVTAPLYWNRSPHYAQRCIVPGVFNVLSLSITFTGHHCLSRPLFLCLTSGCPLYSTYLCAWIFRFEHSSLLLTEFRVELTLARYYCFYYFYSYTTRICLRCDSRFSDK